MHRSQTISGIPGRHRALLASVGIALLACGPVEEPAEGGRASPGVATAIHGRPSVVSLSPLATEFLVALGAADQLIGLDRVSAELPALSDRPIVDLRSADALTPDLIVVPGPIDASDPELGALRASRARVVVFEPHDLEDVFALCQDLGAALVGEARARSFEVEIARPLAEIGGASFGQPRPRILGLVSLDPPVVAGGHSFETDMIEIAGGRSVTHGGLDARLDFGPATLADLAPDILLVMTPDAPSRAALAALSATAVDVPVSTFVVDAARFWLEPDQHAALRLRELITKLPGARR